jgi:hypothetical protein
LRGIEREEDIQLRNAEQEEDGGDESKDTSGDRVRDDSSTGNDTAVANKLKLQKEVGRVNAKLTAQFSSLQQRGPRRESQPSYPR